MGAVGGQRICGPVPDQRGLRVLRFRTEDAGQLNNACGRWGTSAVADYASAIILAKLPGGVPLCFRKAELKALADS